MNLKSLLFIFFVCALIFVGCGDSSTNIDSEKATLFEEVEMKLNLNIGDSIILSHQIKTPPKSKIEWNEFYEFLLIVDKIDTQRNCYFKVFLVSANSTIDFDNDRTSVDTKLGPEGLTGESLEAYNDLKKYLNRPMRMVVSEQMALVQKLSYDDGTPLEEELLDMNKSFIEYPKRALSIGDFFDRKNINGLFQTMDKMNFKVVDIDKSFITLKYEGEIFPNEESTRIMSRLSGKYVIDRNTGLIHNAELIFKEKAMSASILLSQRKPLNKAGLLE